MFRRIGEFLFPPLPFSPIRTDLPVDLIYDPDSALETFYMSFFRHECY